MKMGRVLPLIARTVIRAVLPDIPHDEADYNIVQNNGRFRPFSIFLCTHLSVLPVLSVLSAIPLSKFRSSILRKHPSPITFNFNHRLGALPNAFPYQERPSILSANLSLQQFRPRRCPSDPTCPLPHNPPSTHRLPTSKTTATATCPITFNILTLSSVQIQVSAVRPPHRSESIIHPIRTGHEARTRRRRKRGVDTGDAEDTCRGVGGSFWRPAQCCW